jgi:hypothetical protein
MVRLTAENRRWWILATMTGALFRNRNFSADNAVLGLVQFVLTGLTVFGAIYVQELLGFGPIAAGLSVLPVMVPLLLARGAGQLCGSIGPRGLVAAGAAQLGAGRLTNFASKVGASASDRAHVPAEVQGDLVLLANLLRATFNAVKDSLISGISIALCIRGGMVLAVAVVAWALLRHLPAADAPATRGLAVAGASPAAVRNTPSGATVN